jgi:hypothetical protein
MAEEALRTFASVSVGDKLAWWGPRGPGPSRRHPTLVGVVVEKRNYDATLDTRRGRVLVAPHECSRR